ncbi:MAG: sugar transporter, periplasmic ligand binding protein [Clostridia bacterium]|jgi:ribose transport system substrate-binding protein|nr:sugar transporter, periplasmic ligand binding protein [Clostridia bacterium]
MRKSLVLSLILCLGIAFGFATIQKAAEVTNKTIYIPIIAKGLAVSFWQPVKSGAERAASDLGIKITFEGPQEEAQTQEQLDILNIALARSPQAVILSAVDSKAVTPYLEEAEAKGIPVIGFDSGVDSPIVKTTVATDNYGAGELAALKMVELLDKKGKVAIIIQDSTSQVATNRRDGFIDTITQQYPSMDVVAVGYGAGDAEKSSEIAKQIFKNHPDLKGIFGGNQGSAEGIVKAIRELNKEGEITAIGFDSGKIIVDAVREGILAGAVSQNPQEIGYQAVETAFKAYQGEVLPAFIDTGYVWYDKTNIDNPEIKELLYE